MTRRTPVNRWNNNSKRAGPLLGGLLLALLGGGVASYAAAAEPGVTDKNVRLATLLDLKGEGKSLGEGMAAGLMAALEGQPTHGHPIKLIAKNDFGLPDKSGTELDKLLVRNIFLFVGNTGTETNQLALPRLAAEGIPAFGFTSGIDDLYGGKGPVVNFRPSARQEVETMVRMALQNGIAGSEICAFVRNDAFGMVGVQGIRNVLAGVEDAAPAVAALDQVLATGEEALARNGLGPVGVFTAGTFVSRPAYRSLKEWEERQGVSCKLVVTVGGHGAIASFIGYARYKGEKWVIGVLSGVGGSTLVEELQRFKEFERVARRILLTQVVPPLDAALPIMQEARTALGAKLTVASAEGYLVGRLLRDILDRTKGDLTRKAVLQTAANLHYDLGGLPIDLRGDMQASDLVSLTTLTGTEWRPMTQAQWEEWKR
jgi:branched-chain amino acid transport system substrate-binding protein